jgi:hypothetical protein
MTPLRTNIVVIVGAILGLTAVNAMPPPGTLFISIGGNDVDPTPSLAVSMLVLHLIQYGSCRLFVHPELMHV